MVVLMKDIENTQHECKPGGRAWHLRAYVFSSIMKKQAMEGRLLNANLPKFGTAQLRFQIEDGRSIAVLLHSFPEGRLHVEASIGEDVVADFILSSDDLKHGTVDEKLQASIPGCIELLTSHPRINNRGSERIR